MLSGNNGHICLIILRYGHRWRHNGDKMVNYGRGERSFGRLKSIGFNTVVSDDSERPPTVDFSEIECPKRI